MLPVGDDNREISTTPYVTYVLIAMNAAVFIYELTLGREVVELVHAWGAVPAEITAGRNLLSLVSSMFPHGGWAHVIGNMLFLKVFGDNVEDRFGHGWFLLFYLVTGLLASGAHILVDPDSTVPSVGASGAISGVLGAYVVMFPRNVVLVWFFFMVFAVPAWLMIGFWALDQFLLTVGSIASTEQTTGGIAYAAHAGGFLAGAGLATLLRGSSRGPHRYEVS